MPPILMLSFCAALVGVLLWIEWKDNPEPSIALWIPTIYMLIIGSRPLGSWFVYTTTENSLEGGSPLDRNILVMIILLAIAVIHKRKLNWLQILKDNFWLIFLFLFLAVTILWSDNIYISIKRWIRLAVIIPITMVVLTERRPIQAVISIYRRCAYVLIPLSIVLIKYYPHLGVEYSRWSGMTMWGGVTLTKNSLGQLCAITLIFLVLAFYRRRRNVLSKKSPFLNSADALVFIICIWLLKGPGNSYSATAMGIIFLGVASIILLNSMKNRVKIITTIFLSFAVFSWFMLIYSNTILANATSAFGRDDTFTGRTEIWNQAFKVAERHPHLGTGFGAYWGLEKQMTEVVGGGNSGHNGLIDVYVETGQVGVILLLVLLLSFFFKIRRQFDYSFDLGTFGLCILVMSIVSNYTESQFLKSSSYLWNTMIFLTVLFSMPHIYTNEHGFSEKRISEIYKKAHAI